MHTLKDFIRAPKSELKLGEWHHGKIPRKAFPLSGARPRAYRYGPSYCWRLASFQCLGYDCRVLVLLNEERSSMRASFGVDRNGDTILLCDHEFHADHPGWHCHLHLEGIDELPAGLNRMGKRRWPKSQPSKKEFGATKANAWALAAERYGLVSKGVLI